MSDDQRLAKYRADMAAYVPPDDIWAAEDRARGVVACGLCDDDGYRGSTVCDHVDHRPAAERGMALVREALKAKGAHACHFEREADA